MTARFLLTGVGYDIACGNKAVRTRLHVDEIRPRLPQIMDEIAAAESPLA